MKIRGAFWWLFAIAMLGLSLSSSPHAYGQGLGRFLSPGDLSSLHSEAQGLANCTKCHTLGGDLPERLCLECHEGIGARLEKNRGYHATLTDKKCFECHSDHKGAGYSMVRWNEKKFDHGDRNTGYALRGKHAKIKCRDCHKAKTGKGSKTYLLKSSGCLTCHGDIHKKTLGQQCEDCHNEKTWKGADVRFDHGKTEYPLEGKHARVKCADCHRVKGIFKVRKFSTCVTCHVERDTHKGALGPRCEECHNETSWKVLNAKFNHSKTKYPLKGKHNRVNCDDCHKKRKKGIFKVAKFSTCDASGCHDTPRRGFIHKRQFKERLCTDCHTEDGWKPALFKHDSPEYKGFKLHGRHADTKCEKCHAKKSGKTAIYRPLESQTCDAAGCHDTKGRGDIHGKQFSDRECTDCHTEDGWKPALFKHDSPEYKGFKLHGRHADTKCEKCHQNSAWKPLAQKCFDCHTKDDKHKGRFGAKCEQCHDEKTWKTEKFAHAAIGFRLEGAHKGLRCEDCHQPGKEALGDGEDCAQCHTDPHLNQFGNFCSDCHSANTWEPARFRHSHTGFRLEGAHRATDCESCHKDRVYRNTPVDCYSCHQNSFLGSQSAIHSPSNINCEDCHRAYSWDVVGARNIHSAMTFSGAHKAVESSCNKCHQPGSGALLYPGATFESDCETCHQADYGRIHANGDPPGVAACPQTCALCHNTSTFFGAREIVRCD
ncbi:Cytochrome c family protein [hydrothermal vent metagenome]|uniref:Cytochrome c family protein n=1 Tax=hydrothermal vent metagenome TaxID=652676 RepID=A0A3B1BQ30_9ZZZZ